MEEPNQTGEQTDAKFNPRQGVALGIVFILFFFGACVGRSFGNEDEAVKTTRQSAEQGDAFAQFKLGIMYQNGTGVPKDEKQAVEWYLKSANQGNAGAQWNLGLMYRNGSGVPKDDAKALEWIKKSAEQGNTAAQFTLAHMNSGGVSVDKAKDIEGLKKTAEQGDAVAQYNLGLMYQEGRGVPKDGTTAFEWFSKAAEQGNIDAQLWLALLKHDMATQKAAKEREVPLAAPTGTTLTPKEIFERYQDRVVEVDAINSKGKVAGFGTGFYWRNAEILTNFHVVAQARGIKIKWNQGLEEATFCSLSEKEDWIQLLPRELKAGRPHYQAVEILDRVPEVGENVTVIGNPEGLTNTLSTGIVSGIRKSDGQLWIQITAPVSHGSSGSPVFDSRGRLIGLATMIIVDGQNLNFVTPIGQIAKAVAKTEEKAKDERLKVEFFFRSFRENVKLVEQNKLAPDKAFNSIDEKLLSEKVKSNTEKAKPIEEEAGLAVRAMLDMIKSMTELAKSMGKTPSDKTPPDWDLESFLKQVRPEPYTYLPLQSLFLERMKNKEFQKHFAGNSNNESEALDFADKYLEKYNDPEDQADILHGVIRYYSNNRQYKKAIAVFKRKIKLNECWQEWENFGDIYSLDQNRFEMTNAYLKAIKGVLSDYENQKGKIIELTKEPSLPVHDLAFSMRDIAEILDKLGDRNKALEWYDAAYIIFYRSSKVSVIICDWFYKLRPNGPAKYSAILEAKSFDATGYYKDLCEALLQKNESKIFEILKSNGLTEKAADDMKKRGIDVYTPEWWQKEILPRISIDDKTRLQSVLDERRALRTH